METVQKVNFDWDLLISKIQQTLDDISFESWIKPITFQEIDKDILRITAPSRFMKDWIINNYSQLLISEANKILPNIKHLDIILVDSYKIDIPMPTSEFNEDIKDSISLNVQLQIPLNSNYTFNNFVVGKPNEFAYNAALTVAKLESNNFNPLFIHGGVGLGKTHLMHSIAWQIQTEHPNKKVLYVTAEKFANLFIMALREKNIFSFKELFRNIDVLMIDDFQFLAGKEQTQEEFFHTFNALISQGKKIVLSADKSPLSLDRIEDRILSRLHAGLSVDIHATTYELRVGILETKTEQLKIAIPKEVIAFIAQSVTSNVRELEGALNRIISYHQLMKTKIDLDMAMNVLEDILKHQNKTINIELIQKKVAEYYIVKLADLSSVKKDKTTAMARHIAMYLAKQLTKASLPEIGRKFGGRDHTTVIYSVNKIAGLLKQNMNLENEIKALTLIIQKS